MLQFFRKIRRRLLINNDLRKYLIYAIGEILLVVIGILIALNINNWNESNSQRKHEEQIYLNIKRKVNDDKGVVLGVIDYNNIYLEQYQFAKQIIETNDRSKLDTLIRIAPELWRYSDFNKSSNIYQTMVNSGQLTLLKNVKIVEELQNLEETYIYMNRLEANHFQVILQYVGPGIIENINFSNNEIERPDELFSFRLQNIFFSAIGICLEKKEAYYDALKQIDLISNLIEEELKK